MSYDIDLCLRHPTDHAATIVAGPYPITLARYWHAGLLRPLDELSGQSGLAAAPFLALAARHLLNAGDAYRNHSLAGEHEAATLALVRLWKSCREHPAYILRVSCLTTPPPAAPRLPGGSGSRPPGQRAAQGPPARPAFGEPGGPCTYLVGPYAVQLGTRLHSEQLPDRARIVVSGPCAAGLVEAVAAAVEAFVSATLNAQAGK